MSQHVSQREFVGAFGEDPLRLPDVVALDTTANDWPAVLTALNAHDWGQDHALDLEMPSDELSGIAFEPATGVQVNLWPGDLVAFDFDLAEMRDQDAVDSVCEVARVIGLTTGHRLVFLPEGEPNRAVLRFDPTSDAFELLLDHS